MYNECMYYKMYLCVYIYIDREREREEKKDTLFIYEPSQLFYHRPKRLSSCYALAQLLDMRGAAEEEEVEEMLRKVLEGACSK